MKKSSIITCIILLAGPFAGCATLQPEENTASVAFLEPEGALLPVPLFTENITEEKIEVEELPPAAVLETAEAEIFNENLQEQPSQVLSKTPAVSRSLYDTGIKTEKELYSFFITHCRQNRFRARKIARLYIEECAAEGINSDVAFVQMCHETNFLRFGNLVKKEWNNFCGLGAINAEQPGLKFKTMRDGVRAHIQHLHAYATTEDIVLKNELIDPRYKYVRPRGKATTIEGLAGTWAADRAYSEKLEKYLCELEGL